MGEASWLYQDLITNIESAVKSGVQKGFTGKE